MKKNISMSKIILSTQGNRAVGRGKFLTNNPLHFFIISSLHYDQYCFYVLTIILSAVIQRRKKLYTLKFFTSPRVLSTNLGGKKYFAAQSVKKNIFVHSFLLLFYVFNLIVHQTIQDKDILEYIQLLRNILNLG